MKKISAGGQSPAVQRAQPPELRALRKRLGELHELYLEATDILRDLIISPSAEIVRGLCARFRILQEYFVMRYHEARALANTALGSVQAALSFPDLDPVSARRRKPTPGGT